MPYPLIALISILLFSSVHLFANRTCRLNKYSHGRLLSIGGGVAIAYVFIDLLPKLGKGELVVEQALSGAFPYFERHVYILALAGFLLFFLTDRKHFSRSKKAFFPLSLFSYALFNFLIGYAVTDKNNPEVQPLILFTIAIALHYFTIDYSLNKTHGRIYQEKGKWILISTLFLGWCLGMWISLPKAAIALVSAFIGGGVVMNVIRHELPAENPHNTKAFLFSAIAYTVILLAIGS